jgi:hypothetical protein
LALEWLLSGNVISPYYFSASGLLEPWHRHPGIHHVMYLTFLLICFGCSSSMEKDSNALILPCKTKNKAQGKGKVVSNLFGPSFLGFLLNRCLDEIVGVM